MTVHEIAGENGRGNTLGNDDALDSGDYASDQSVEELSLVDDDEPLPWLESDYDDEEPGFDSGRFIGFILLSLLALAFIVGVVWWFSNPGADPELVGDGSTIESPEGPVKERPEDAGGKEFEGTGNVAPKVGQGISSQSTMDQGEAPKPSIDAATSANQDAGGASASSNTGGVGVQVGAFGSRQSAEQAWNTLSGQTQALSGFKFRIVEGQVDGGTVFRLQAVAGDAAAASKLCGALKSDGIACQVKN